MSLQKISQIPLKLASAQKKDARSQFGAICYRYQKGKPQVLLITTRGTGRWIVPKGWPMPGESPSSAAAVEAYEEAGVEGRVHPVCLGIYSYTKIIDDKPDLPCVVALYAVRVSKLLNRFPEKHQRKRKWVSPKRAAAMVDEPELRAILAKFDPVALGLR
ncbi:MAG: NUDIX hydrolase [Pseudomonadota bacterium]